MWQPSEIGCESVPRAPGGTETSSRSTGSQQHLSCSDSRFRELHLLRQCCTSAQTALHLSTDSEGRSHRHLSHTWERLMSKVWVCDPPQTAAAFHMKGRGVLLKDKGSKSVRLTLSLCRLVVAFPCATASVMVEYRGDGHRAWQWPGAPAPSTFSWGLALWAGSAGSGRLRLASRHGGLPPPPCKVLDPGCWILPNEK